MNGVDRMVAWNRWYDGLPMAWRFQMVLWPFIILGAINLMLTVSMRFPFGLLLILGFIAVAVIRVPYLRGRYTPSADFLPKPDTPLIRFRAPDWMIEANRRYEALPEVRRMYVVPGLLIVAGAINMLLTIGYGFPFGLLFLLALLAVVAVRAPYVQGWINPPVAASGVVVADGMAIGPDAEASTPEANLAETANAPVDTELDSVESTPPPRSIVVAPEAVAEPSEAAPPADFAPIVALGQPDTVVPTEPIVAEGNVKPTAAPRRRTKRQAPTIAAVDAVPDSQDGASPPAT